MYSNAWKTNPSHHFILFYNHKKISGQVLVGVITELPKPYSTNVTKIQDSLNSRKDLSKNPENQPISSILHSENIPKLDNLLKKFCCTLKIDFRDPVGHCLYLFFSELNQLSKGSVVLRNYICIS